MLLHSWREVRLFHGPHTPQNGVRFSGQQPNLGEGLKKNKSTHIKLKCGCLSIKVGEIEAILRLNLEPHKHILLKDA